MRILATLAVILLVPLAAADQDIAAGPARLTTVNGWYGDGCSGTNGGETRDVNLFVEDPRGDGNKQIGIANGCSRYEGPGYEYTGSYLSVYASSTEFTQTGPSAYYSWYGGDANGQRYCGSLAGSSSTYVYLGCPSPDGSAPPLLPALP